MRPSGEHKNRRQEVGDIDRVWPLLHSNGFGDDPFDDFLNFADDNPQPRSSDFKIEDVSPLCPSDFADDNPLSREIAGSLRDIKLPDEYRLFWTEEIARKILDEKEVPQTKYDKLRELITSLAFMYVSAYLRWPFRKGTYYKPNTITEPGILMPWHTEEFYKKWLKSEYPHTRQFDGNGFEGFRRRVGILIPLSSEIAAVIVRDLKEKYGIVVNPLIVVPLIGTAIETALTTLGETREVINGFTNRNAAKLLDGDGMLSWRAEFRLRLGLEVRSAITRAIVRNLPNQWVLALIAFGSGNNNYVPIEHRNVWDEINDFSRTIMLSVISASIGAYGEQKSIFDLREACRGYGKLEEAGVKDPQDLKRAIAKLVEDLVLLKKNFKENLKGVHEAFDGRLFYSRIGVVVLGALFYKFSKRPEVSQLFDDMWTYFCGLSNVEISRSTADPEQELTTDEKKFISDACRKAGVRGPVDSQRPREQNYQNAKGADFMGVACALTGGAAAIRTGHYVYDRHVEAQRARAHDGRMLRFAGEAAEKEAASGGRWTRFVKQGFETVTRLARYAK